MFEPIKAPWIHPGVVIHEASAPVDGLLTKFSQLLCERGFRLAGTIQKETADGIELFDIASGRRSVVTDAARALRVTSLSLRAAMRDDVDLAIISHFSAFENAAHEMLATIEEGISQGMPVLTSVPGSDLQRWLDFAGQRGAILSPNMRSLWQWWGPERLYNDLALGVAEDEVRQIVCGPRWLMVEGPHGAGLAYLPRKGKDMAPRLQQFRRQSLRQLADLSRSWDPLEMAVGIAAINAHYNRYDLDGAPGNGAGVLGAETGRVVVVGAFPGLSDTFANPQVIENEPRPGEYPSTALDTLLPGCGAAVVASSALINRSLPRILRLAHGSRIALIGPVAPMTPRLHHYGIEVIGGLLVRDAAGLASAIRAGALPREFVQFGHYCHVRHDRNNTVPRCRFRADSLARGQQGTAGSSTGGRAGKKPSPEAPVLQSLPG